MGSGIADVSARAGHDVIVVEFNEHAGPATRCARGRLSARVRRGRTRPDRNNLRRAVGRLGIGHAPWGGDLEASLRLQLAPIG
ncbi:hypothetical protein [Nocardioides sp. AN3]